MKTFEIYNANNAIKLDRDRKWPVVYILRDDKKMYIGETTNIQKRLVDHAKNEVRKNLFRKIIIKHKEANKSLTFTIESDLINRALADKTYKITNKKMQSNAVLNGHDFFNKENVLKDSPMIWNDLKEMGIFRKEYKEIENEELFKYSPWKEFSDNQLEIINFVNNSIIKNENCFIEGGAGTGKTVVIIRTAMNHILCNSLLKIGIYSAKNGNFNTFKRVIFNIDPIFKKNIKILKNLKSENIQNLDYILVDEGQRLRKTYGGMSSPTYFKNKIVINEIEWFKKNNIKYAIFYDLNQRFTKDDIDLRIYIENKKILTHQFRIKAGDDYIQFIKEMLQISDYTKKIFDFENFSFKIFETTQDLFEEVKKMNNLNGIFNNKSRMIASRKFKEWITKETFKDLTKAKNLNYRNIKTDFTFGKYKAVWNKLAYYHDWLERSDVSEVGCVHTVQGRDLKYAGVLFADDIKIKDNKIIASDSIKNQYFILLTRGIYGSGLYIKDPELKKYISNFIAKKIKKNS